MFQYVWDPETGGLLLTTEQAKFSKEPRPVYYRELDILGFDQYWNYPKDDKAPLMWAEANNYIYRGRLVAKTKGGMMYQRPELIIVEMPDESDKTLFPVNVDEMCRKNRGILETLAQETIRKTYNTYLAYKNQVDLFYVAFSGGKDSVVALDIVQRALPHDDFKVIFGDTLMEFPDTYDVIDKVEAICRNEHIDFLRSRSEYEPEITWPAFGPPAQKMRWCCSVHKTAPQILMIRELLQNPHFRGMAFMGVRADESIARSKYEQLNFGTKHKGQYDFYPILYWNSAELFLYIYTRNLILNETYKKGNSRAGCLSCPMEADKNSWFKEQSYAEGINPKQTTTFFHNMIIEQTVASGMPEENQREFMNFGVWTSRHNGKKLAHPDIRYSDSYSNGIFKAEVRNARTDWRIWLKTIGEVDILENGDIKLQYEGSMYYIHYKKTQQTETFELRGLTNKQQEIYLVAYLKNVFRKSTYCITCRVCEANCPHGFIHMRDGNVSIDDRCVKCKMCHSVPSGCLVADSNLLPKESKSMSKSVDRYKNMGIRYPWIVAYFDKKDGFWEDNELGTMMVTALRAFLSDAEISEGDKITSFGEVVTKLGANNELAWGLMLCNLANTSQFRWWIENIQIGEDYSEDRLKLKNIVSGFKYIFYSNPILDKVMHFGSCECEEKGRNLTLIRASRGSWPEPIPEVILYGLYKFAENCGNYYQFSLETLLDDSIERDGVSPTRIFGLNRDTMVRLLNSLSIHYPEFISASFTLDLDTITLNAEKTAEDVLALF